MSLRPTSLLVLAISPLSLAAGTPRPEVVLNHFSRVVDAETYQAIAGSDFLKTQLCAFSQKSVSSGPRTWTGSYLYGERTYLELYLPSPTEGEVGTTGMAFGVETAGATPRLMPALATATGGEVTLTLRTVAGPAGRQVPWFYMLRSALADRPNTHRWVMEFEPGFLRTIRPETPPGTDGLLRRNVNARFQTPNRLLRDFTGATLAMSEAEADHFVKELAVYGYATRSEGIRRIASGPGLELQVVPATPAEQGLIELRFRLQRPASGAYPLGSHAALTLSGDSGRLAFTAVKH